MREVVERREARVWVDDLWERWEAVEVRVDTRPGIATVLFDQLIIVRSVKEVTWSPVLAERECKQTSAKTAKRGAESIFSPTARPQWRHGHC